ncbi:hypothetical protein BMF94_3987 [Rhodotorula taiwanensis]|uniref:Uncharacterized protein n=1 Tax=Rhodotorula taiwanensis TaxID=741276 RepID=A0A2S5B8F3_9BASI|nr:hypothetical protein BMF94_3987 [Rhodotorula taiwanensis]
MSSAYTRPALEQALGAINAAYGFKMQPGLAKFRGAVDFALTLARDRYGHTFRLAGHSDVLEALADICKEIKDANPRPVPSGKDAKTRIERLDAILHKKQLVTLLCEAAYNAANARRDRPKPHPTPIPNGDIFLLENLTRATNGIEVLFTPVIVAFDDFYSLPLHKFCTKLLGSWRAHGLSWPTSGHLGPIRTVISQTLGELATNVSESSLQVHGQQLNNAYPVLHEAIDALAQDPDDDNIIRTDEP